LKSKQFLLLSTMTRFSQKLKKIIIDTIFPIKCISCNTEGFWICSRCQLKIATRDEHVCGICEKTITPDGRTCQACKKHTGFSKNRIAILDGFIDACEYSNPTVSKAVHLFKYRFIPDLHIPLGDLLIKAFQKTNLPLPDIIVPVPLHQKRLRWRGFNQSELLANHISKNLLPNSEIEICPNLLSRIKNTSPQMKVKDYQSRQQNIANAFCLSPNIEIKNKTILLVDDIATTGSTINECVKILKKSGGGDVFAIVIARQETKR